MHKNHKNHQMSTPHLIGMLSFLSLCQLPRGSSPRGESRERPEYHECLGAIGCFALLSGRCSVFGFGSFFSVFPVVVHDIVVSCVF